MGRPSTKSAQAPKPAEYSLELAEAICSRIAQGESLREICNGKGMPSPALVCKWAATIESFREQYARAREQQGDSDADRVTEVANQVLTGKLDPNAARVAIDALKWSAAKRKPKVYGDKVEVTGRMTLESLVLASMKPATPAES